MSKREDEVTPGAADKTKTTTASDRKLQANRENAKRSTGPKTALGKRHSSFNAMKHGLLSKRLMLDTVGKSEEGLQQLLQSLRDEYGNGDVRVEILLECIGTEYWRQWRGLEHERYCLGKGADAFHPQGMMHNIFRYMSGSRRALLQSLELLEKLRYSKGEGIDSGASGGSAPAEEMALDEQGQEPRACSAGIVAQVLCDNRAR
ncbi:MAG: hypothetical protein JWO20_516 [Candidatus Angelobacter sp.]|nr:hypothetical protein [Candidatus Angelobacter sp.]